MKSTGKKSTSVSTVGDPTPASTDLGDELGTTLSVWAHPDDEAYLSGGLMALAREAGHRVVCVTATRGERGTDDEVEWPPDRLARERTAELARCLDVLGVVEHAWLDLPDGGCADVPAAGPVAVLSELIAQLRPQTVLTFGPDGITGHPDHRQVSAWTTAAFAASAPPGSRLLHAAVPERWARTWGALEAELGVYLPGYPVTASDDRLVVDLVCDDALVARKVRALLAQQTQTQGLVEAVGLERYTEWVRKEAFVDATPTSGPARTGPAAASRV